MAKFILLAICVDRADVSRVSFWRRPVMKTKARSALRLQDHLRTLLDPKLAEHGGLVGKNHGDGLLAEISSIVEAVRCAPMVQCGVADAAFWRCP